MSDGVVVIHGREYRTVALRVKEFREKHPDWSIQTTIKFRAYEDAERVLVRATIKDVEGRLIASGTAEENRAQGNINLTSCVENAETSAVGRALSFFGLGGEEIASAEEMTVDQLETELRRQIDYMALVRDQWDTISYVKEQLAIDEVPLAKEALAELDIDTKMALWKAPTKGGVFTTEERKILKEGKHD